MQPPDPSDERLTAALRLSMVSGVGPITRQALVARFGSAAAVLSAAPSDLREVSGVGPKVCRAICAANDLDPGAEIAICRQHDVSILIESSPEYPQSLQTIPDPPGVLFVRGDLRSSDSLSVGMVGTRHATAYGLAQAERLAAGLARAGYTIISGLARGIDAAAHRGALSAGGRTIAVLGSGVLSIYPPEHEKLAGEVAVQGAIVSEFLPRMQPMAGAFPQRNRIVTGMSLGVIVVEAADRSGALISARHAMEQGREVFAVPGRVDSRMSRGCHQLLRDGAKLVEGVDDVLEELGPLTQPAQRDDGREIRHPAELQLNDVEQQVLAAVNQEVSSIDEIVVACGLPVSRVLATISALELRRIIRRVSGNRVARI